MLILSVFHVVMVRIVAIGLGNRTGKYLRFVREHPDRVMLVAVAETDPERLIPVKTGFGLPDEVCFASCGSLFDSGIEADACIIGTPDNSHFEIAMAAVRRGWHVLLEKPMAQSSMDCRRLSEAARKAGVMVAVCYVLRYHPYFMRLKELSAGSDVGRIISVDHTEQVGYDRLAHTFVRGPWNMSEMNTTMFLSKCCHDVDFVLWLIGNDVVEVASEVREGHFNRASMPPDAASRCIDCPLEGSCRFSAPDLYLRRRDWTGGFLPRAGESLDDAVLRELKEGRYGRCVYLCDGNVAVEKQTVSLKTRSGIKATVTMDSLTENDNRVTLIECENAVISGDESSITVTYRDGRLPESYDFSWCRGSRLHANADMAIVDDFIDAVSTGRMASKVDVSEALTSHLICFAAETLLPGFHPLP